MLRDKSHTFGNSRDWLCQNSPCCFPCCTHFHTHTGGKGAAVIGLIPTAQWPMRNANGTATRLGGESHSSFLLCASVEWWMWTNSCKIRKQLHKLCVASQMASGYKFKRDPAECLASLIGSQHICGIQIKIYMWIVLQHIRVYLGYRLFMVQEVKWDIQSEKVKMF